MSGLVAIVGRPNVGKSTLFNLLTRSQRAIVDDRPGVTRDRLYGEAVLDRSTERSCTVIDTGGFETDDFNFQPFAQNIVWLQTEQAIIESDVVILLLDGKAGLQPHDKELFHYLVKAGKPFVTACNKIDGAEQKGMMFEFYDLGIEPVGISAAHKRGIDGLLEELEEKLDEVVSKANNRVSPAGATKIALIGRPNVGKSSILNRLIGEERSLVSDVAGTTRDSVDVCLKYHGETLTVVDTAGMRRKSRITDKLESLSVIRSLKAIDAADVVLLVLEATSGLTDQDARLASHAVDRHKPLLIVVNKWDLYPEKNANSARDFTLDLRDSMRALAFVPLVFVSCLENKRIHSLLEQALKLDANSKKRVSTARVNEVLQSAVHSHTPALMKTRRRVKFYYGTQVSASPPTFVVFCNVAGEIQESYKRYMTHRFREELGFDSVPLRLFFRDKQDIRDRTETDESKASVHS